MIIFIEQCQLALVMVFFAGMNLDKKREASPPRFTRPRPRNVRDCIPFDDIFFNFDFIHF